MNDLSNQYIAGLFDGEGCISIVKYKNKTGSYYYLRIALSNNNREVVKKLHIQFGGGYTEREKIYQWHLSANQAMDFLLRIYPYLIVKKTQADLAFKFCSHIQDKKLFAPKLGHTNQVNLEREEMFLLMKGLKRI